MHGCMLATPSVGNGSPGTTALPSIHACSGIEAMGCLVMLPPAQEDVSMSTHGETSDICMRASVYSCMVFHVIMMVHLGV